LNHDRRFRPLRQEREPQYLETGAVYVMRVPGFLQAKHRFFGKTALHIMPSERRLEIDDPVDFEIAGVLLQEQAAREQVDKLPEHIAALVLDFDGVVTDNKVIVFQDGKEAVRADRSDGWGIGKLKKTGLPILVLSTEPNPVVKARADKLGLPVLQGIQEKWGALQVWLAERGIDPAQVVYVGNDENDLSCMTQVGYAVAPADAYPAALQAAHLVLKHRGGDGAVRELCDLILQHLRSNP
jgi:N-acylneuraminate cytidylyltransferase